MVPRLTVSAAAIVCSCVVAFAEASPALPLASHRAAYDISLVDPATPPPTSAQTPVSATGLIAYEFRGSACEGYTSNFRQMTEMERSEGDPLSMQVNAMSFEEADGKSMRFQVELSGTARDRAGRRHRDAGRGRRLARPVDETAGQIARFRP